MVGALTDRTSYNRFTTLTLGNQRVSSDPHEQAIATGAAIVLAKGIPAIVVYTVLPQSIVLLAEQRIFVCPPLFHRQAAAEIVGCVTQRSDQPHRLPIDDR